MAGIHFKKHFKHRCTVQRMTSSQSASGEVTESEDDSWYINCRYIQRSHRIAAEGVGFMMLQQSLLLCDAGEDVQEEDLIADITLRSDKSVVDAGPFTVEAFLERTGTAPHHISMALERVE